MRFLFETNNESFQYCSKILVTMQQDFGISEQEAIDRINDQWKNDTFTDEMDIRYHESPQFWAYHMYYGSASEWWNREGDPTLKPLPYNRSESEVKADVQDKRIAMSVMSFNLQNKGNVFQFTSSEETLRFGQEIVRELVQQFSLSEQDAINLMMRPWPPLAPHSQHDYNNQLPAFWARHIYRGGIK